MLAFAYMRKKCWWPVADEILLTTRDVAERLKVSMSTVMRYCRYKNCDVKRVIPTIKVGNSVRIRESDLLAWLEERTKR